MKWTEYCCGIIVPGKPEPHDPNPDMNRRHTLQTIAAAAAFPFIAARAQAAWPQRTVRLLVGFPGGSTPDLSARSFAEALARSIGQPVIVENKVGASGNIAAEAVARATDDHTFGVVINGNLTTAKLLNPKLPFDPAADLMPLSLLTTAPLVLLAAKELPAGAAFFDAAKSAGDRWNYGSVGAGSLAHLGMELLKDKVPGLKAVHIPFPGNPQVVTALLGGQIQMALVPPGLALPQVQVGKLKAIGLSGGRSVLVPNVPSLADLGIKGFELEVWTALVAPKGLPKPIAERVARAVADIARQPDTRQHLFNQGWQAVGTSPDGLRQRVQQETAQLRAIIAARGIKGE
jgi:tripartite-type tricarboxylate transporter receptor subunit TctC